MFLFPDRSKNTGRMMPKAVYLLILIIAATGAGALGYGAFLGNLPARLVPVIEAAEQIKIQISLAQLRAAAALPATQDAKSLKAWSHYNRARDLVDFLRSDQTGMLSGLNSPAFRDLLQRTQEQIDRCKRIAGRRLQMRNTDTASDVSRQAQAEFDQLLSLADEIHVQAGIVARNSISAFRRVQFSLIVASALLAVLAFVVIYRFDRRRADDYNVIQSQNHQLQATEQQLRASNQQLQATEQQLRASNQQLQATEQQLRASNQQLQANEQALRLSESRYRSLFANMSEGMALLNIVYDNSGTPVNYRIVDLNRQFEEIFGITREKAEGRLATEAFETEAPLHLGEYARVAETGDVRRFETYYSPLDRHFLVCLYSPERGSCAAVFTDVTDRKKAADAVRRDALRLETLMEIANHKAADVKDLLHFALRRAVTLLESTTGCIYLYDDKTQVFTLDACTCETKHGCAAPPEEGAPEVVDSAVLNRAVGQLQPVVLNRLPSDASARCTEGQKVLRRLMVIPVVRNGRPVAVACAANKKTDFDDRDAREFALLMDSVWKIIDLRREQEERVRLETRIQKLESVGVLAGGIAHDFNNLLTAILANVTFAKMQLRDGERIDARLEDIEMASTRAQDLTQQLLTFAKGGKPVMKLVGLEPVIRDSASLAVSGSKVQCQFRFADDLCSAQVDVGQISQVINNLVINAVQAMPAGGTVRIEAENTYVDPDDPLPVDAGRYVRVSVSDQGIGIPSEHIDRIFDPYFTTKQKGSGLGLAVSHSVVTGHRGHIAVESHLGAGTAFHVYLPASCDNLLEAPGISQPRIGGNGRVLVMDDEEMLRKVCGDILKRFGYEVESVPDGREAVERYEQRLKEGKPFDAVILDLTVPGGMGGREAIEHILRIDPKARALVSSGYSNDPVMADYRAHGFCGLIPKPYTLKTLSDAVNAVIASRRKEYDD